MIEAMSRGAFTLVYRALNLPDSVFDPPCVLSHNFWAKKIYNSSSFSPGRRSFFKQGP
jgi:hypothetical protein